MLRDPASLKTILRECAASISIFDIIRIREFIERECAHVPRGYREAYIKTYTGIAVEAVLALKGGVGDITADRKSLLRTLKRLYDTSSPLIVVLTVIYRNFILSEPLHPVGTPFPGSYSVTEEHGTYYCPVKDKQKDNPSALCDICIAEQTPMTQEMTSDREKPVKP
ncbi:DUF2115 domain-containing protein [Methanothermobacter marburgensis]|uniref:UPF0305 protein MTBMA_c12070 n=1 Tax=Methanothermobacter marburgensis (strain ATCC BAA-927 / DSM 2133 / JCM 14651 / NBRC 100331 / OCM 82 / Marburg) TaxID=79929 RepID=D9PX49_METTM|nr:DUF2115 domain-containing protein [Methanothermobacter marburgensis]ADL58797.1 conserved hypothetical protein [Methanothermobacter marburgensis str. Marburg]WBF09357.1 DUF2115 domain-containing protein [Methanothermobacter marburgensis]